MSLVTKGIFQFGPFRLDAGERGLDRAGTVVALTPKVFDLLLLLVQNPGKLLQKATILETVWNGVHVDESVLTRAVSDLRKALGQTAEESWIETVPKFGYRFCGEVQFEGAETEAAIPATGPADSRRRAPWASVVIALAGAVVALGVLFAGRSLWRSMNHPAPLLHGSGWVLVANFENRTGERLFDGTVEYALERELSNSQFVKVVPRVRVEDALRLIKKPLDSRVDVTLGREICLRDGEIQTLITGRVEKLGTTYVLSSEIINPANSVPLATLSEEARADTQVAAAIRRLSTRVRQAVGEDHRLIQQSDERLEKVTTPSLHALQLYSQADRVVARGREGNLSAVELLEQALREDPDFASAHNLLGWAYANLGKDDKALPHFQRAFELADSTPDREKFFILGSYYQRALNQREKAAAAYEALLRLYPDHYWGNNNLALYYAGLLRREHDAMEHFVRTADLRPNDLHANVQAVYWLMIEASWAPAYPDTTRRNALNRAQTYNARALKLLEVDSASPSRQADGDQLRLALVQQDWLAGNLPKMHADLLWFMREDKTLPAATRVTFLLELGELHDAVREAAGNNFLLGALAFYQGDLLKARELLDSQQPDDPNRLDLAASVMIRLRMLSEAEKLYRKMLIVYRTPYGLDPGVHVVEGQLALARGETAKGIDLLERALPEDEGSSPTALGYEALGDTYRKMGKRDDAVRVLERESGVQAGGNLAEGFRMRVRLQLADLYRELGRISDAERVESGLRRELVLADADHPILLALAQRGAR